MIAGLLLATRLSGHNDQAASTEQLLRWAEELEGHVDNAAAAYHGGLVLALSSGVDRPITLKTAFPEAIRLVIISPAIAVPTHDARGRMRCTRCNARRCLQLRAFPGDSISFLNSSTTVSTILTAESWCRGLRAACACATRACWEPRSAVPAPR